MTSPTNFVTSFFREIGVRSQFNPFLFGLKGCHVCRCNLPEPTTSILSSVKIVMLTFYVEVTIEVIGVCANNTII